MPFENIDNFVKEKIESEKEDLKHNILKFWIMFPVLCLGFLLFFVSFVHLTNNYVETWNSTSEVVFVFLCLFFYIFFCADKLSIFIKSRKRLKLIKESEL
jgi:hypothetical protein